MKESKLGKRMRDDDGAQHDGISRSVGSATGSQLFTTGSSMASAAQDLPTALEKAGLTDRAIVRLAEQSSEEDPRSAQLEMMMDRRVRFIAEWSGSFIARAEDPRQRPVAAVRLPMLASGTRRATRRHWIHVHLNGDGAL